MAFKSVGGHFAKFNSATSGKFLDDYINFVQSSLEAEASSVPNKTFAPSSMRCDRLSWFRLRGVTPDVNKNPDLALNFTAKIGTACHRIIQSNLINLLKDDWITVPEYLKSIEFPYDYSLEVSGDGLETKICISDPPINFACDGIVKYNGSLYLLEIKTSEFNAWSDMINPKSEHIDQVLCYATLLQLDNILMIYQDRQYGGLKCYELRVAPSQKDAVLAKLDRVMEAVRTNIAPDGLPKGDKWCQPSMCKYFNKCKEY